MKKRLMIDIETTGLTPAASVWQIGWCNVGGAPVEGLLHLNPYDQHRDIDSDTLEWLVDVTPDWVEMRPIFPTLADTSELLSDWAETIADMGLDEIWCKGADFDFVILRSIFRQYDITMPWKYNRQCCMRSFNHTWPEFEIDYSGSTHNALHDAKIQAKCLENILTFVGRL